MTDQTRRSWRASAPTLTVVVLFTLAVVLVVPALAYLIYLRQGSPWIPAGLGALTLLSVVYAWRFGLHPRLQATETGVVVSNPFRRHRLNWDDIRVIAPGENGLIVASEEEKAEAWCIQKSNHAARRGRLTRADRVTAELLDLLDEHDPPLEDEETGLRIRRARPDEARLLTRLERAASEDALSHIFPPASYPYPVTEVTRRWRRALLDPHVQVRVLELLDAPVGYVAYDASTVRHLGVLPHHGRRGYGSALLEFATQEIFDGGAPQADLWVLSANDGARRFYASHGWTETEDRRTSPYPPKPEELRLTRRNPAAPRRSR